MAEQIDRLEIQIEAQATKANQQLDNLIDKLGKVSDSLTKVNSSGLTGLANGVQKFSNASSTLKQVNTADFTRLAKNISNLSSINTEKIYSAASSMTILGKSLTNLGEVSQSSIQIADVAKSISKIGGSNVQKAITNLPLLATAMKELMQTLSGAPRVNENIIQMTNALARLSSQGAKVGTASKSLSAGMERYSTSASKATGSTKGLASSIGMFYASCFLAIRAVKALGKAVESSMDFLETSNYFEVAFGKIGSDAAGQWQDAGYKNAEAYARSFSERSKELTAKMTGYIVDESGNATSSGMKNLGLNPDDVMQWQAVYAQMTDSLGIAEESTLRFSKALTMLGADWASLRNISLDTSWNKFASALAGQSRAVRSLGIDVTQATLQEYALEYGITKSVMAMNQAEKAQLRLIAMLRQSEVAFGDLANTIGSPSNQLRILEQNISNLARTIGNIFLPIVSKILPYINGLVIALQRLFQWIGGLLGINLEGINTSMDGMDDFMGDFVGGAEDAEDALDKVNAAAKKTKNTVLGMDELNINAPQESSGGGASGGGAGGGSPVLDDAIAKALEDYEKKWNDAFNRMENKAQEFADKISEFFKKIYNATEPFRNSLKKLWDEGLSKLASFTWTALKDFYNEFLVPIGKWAFGTEGAGLTRLVDIINNSLMKINWDELNRSLKEFWIAIEPYAEQFGEGLIDFFEDVSNFAVNIINKFPGVLDKITSALNNGDPERARDWGYAFGQIALGIVSFKLALKGFFAVEAAITLLNKFRKLGEWFAGTALGKMISQLPSLSSVLITFANALSYIGMASPAMLPALFDKLSQEFPKIADAFSWFTNPKGILAIINNWLNDIVDGIANMAKEIPGAIKAVFKNTFNWDSTFELFNEAFENFSEAFDGKKIAVNILKGIGNGFLGAIGIVIEPIGDLFIGFVNAIRDTFGMHSPAKKMYPFGENILLGIVEGFTSKFSEFYASIETWWNEYVSPWFTVEQWSMLWENIKIAFSTKWQELVEWWNTSTLILWWEENVSPWFSVETWTTLLTNINTAFKNIWNNLVKWWNENAITKWWRENVQPYFTLEFWSDGMKGIIEAFEQVFKNAANVAIDIFNKLIEWINEKMYFEWDSITIAGKKIVPSGSVQLFTIPPIPKFEAGGLPEDGFFFANHKELVGKFTNGRTAVANNDMITAGIEEAAYRGFSRAYSENDREASLLEELIVAVREGRSIIIDGREIVTVYDSRKERNGYPLT